MCEDSVGQFDVALVVPKGYRAQEDCSEDRELVTVVRMAWRGKCIKKRNVFLQAGILEPPPRDEDAVATRLGLWLNCINSGLYMVRTLHYKHHIHYSACRDPTGVHG